jgi:hypothetical protein
MYRFNPAHAIYPVDPERLDLAREFRANPNGPHSRELQNVINRMRSGAISGKWVLYPLTDDPSWALAQIPEKRDAPLIIHEDLTFCDRSEAEWYVFKLRWEEITGQTLELS